MTDRELMQQVLEALEGWNHVLEPKPDAELISALRSRLAQPVQEPLTDEEISDAVREADFDWHYGWTLDDEEPNRFTKFARAIEAKLKEKNT